MTKQQLNPCNIQVNELIDRNLSQLASRLSKLEDLFQDDFYVTSGLRTISEQMRINPTSKKSAHLTGEACDVLDVNKKVWDFLVDNLEYVAELGLYLESKVYTPKHVHIQTRKPMSGHRIFIP